VTVKTVTFAVFVPLTTNCNVTVEHINVPPSAEWQKFVTMLFVRIKIPRRNVSVLTVAVFH